MKKTYLFGWMLFALAAFTLTSCDNEPLAKDQFLIEEGETGIEAELGQFVANIAGTEFIAETVSATVDPTTNAFEIKGTKSDGQSIQLNLGTIDLGSFTLGSSITDLGRYVPAGDSFVNAYLSISVGDNPSQLTITEFDATNKTVSGTFSFNGVRVLVDANGDPILDSDGLPQSESITITEGSFNTITYIDGAGDGGGGDGEDPIPPTDEFFALVDGGEFSETTLTTTEIVVGGEPVLKIIATDAVGGKFELFIPKGLGVGTFDMVSILDGPVLLASYNPGTGGATLTSNPGTMTITQFGDITGKLAGTFSFTGTDPIDATNTETASITEGSFSVDYIDNTGGVDNTFTADINTVNYMPETYEVSETTIAGIVYVVILTQNATTNESLTISFPKDIIPGAYAMAPAVVDGTEVVAIYNPNVGASILFTSNPGTFTITGYDTFSGIIEAAFSFQAIDPAANDPMVFDVTNGQMVVNLN